VKILVRTLIILLAAAVVTGATLGALQVPAVQNWISSSQGGERHGPPAGMVEGQFSGSPEFAEGADANAAALSQEGGTNVTDASTASTASTDSMASTDSTDSTDSTAATGTVTGTPTRPMRGEGGGRSGGNLAGLVEVGKNLGIVIVVSLAIAVVGWMGKRFRPHRPATAAV